MTKAQEFIETNKKVGCRYCLHHHTKKAKNANNITEVIHICGATNNAECSVEICPYKDKLLKFESYDEYVNSFDK